jgi:hypothetical protein
MTVRFACAASALTFGCALSAPAFAQGPDSVAIDAAAATVIVKTTEADKDGTVTDFDLTRAAAPAGSAIAVGAGSSDVAVSSAALAAAAQAAPKREESYSVVLNQDSFFGFYPTFNALIPVSDKMDLSVYGIMWTTDLFGGPNLGSNLWTEFGIGVNIYAMDGKLTVKPQLGITNGRLLSGGTDDGNGGNFLDGLVPSLTVNYSDDAFEAEYYGGYYAAVRNRNERGLDFLHTWLNMGAKFTPNFSAGGHYEILSLTRSGAPGGQADNIYHWVGPYVQFKLSNGFFARFTGGFDVGEGNSGDFYKLAVGMSF